MSTSHNVSPARLAANRANAAESSGPRTPEGKARSAQNARKHGFAAAAYSVVRLEDVHEAAQLKEDAAAVYRPVNSQEMAAIEQIALTRLAMLRAARLEAGFFTSCLNEMFDLREMPKIPISDQLTYGIEVAAAQNRNFLLFEGFKRNVANSNAFALCLRYSAQAERQYRRAIEEFERLKALRPELQNEPISDAGPAADEPEDPPIAVDETNPFPPELKQTESLTQPTGNPPLIPAAPPLNPLREPAGPALADS